MAVPRGWERWTLGKLGAQATPQNIKFLQAWQKAEGGGTANNANYNPLNTTWDFDKYGSRSINKVGVRSYVTPQQGLNATLKTLQQGYYKNIVQGLRKNIGAAALAQAVANSPWGTGQGVANVLKGGFTPSAAPATGAPGFESGSVQFARRMQTTPATYDTAWSLRDMDAVPLASANSPGENFATTLLNSMGGGGMSTEGMIGAIMQLRSDIDNLSTGSGGFSVGGLDSRIGKMPTPAKTTYSMDVLPGGGGVPQAAPTGGGGPGITELFYDPLGGIKNNASIGAIGNHSDHVHVSMPSLRTQRAVEQYAQQMGLHVGEEQDSTVDPVHVKTSYHYQNWPGTKWRKAADISGSPKQMAALYRWVSKQYGK